MRCLRGKIHPTVMSRSGICPLTMNMSEMNARGMTTPLLTARVTCIEGSAMARASPSALKQAEATTSVVTIARTDRLGTTRS